jgi:hypothetical protein
MPGHRFFVTGMLPIGALEGDLTGELIPRMRRLPT